MRGFFDRDQSRFAHSGTCFGTRFPSSSASHRVPELDLVYRICGKAETPNDPIEVHHLIPVAHGGTHSEENLVATHRSCYRLAHQEACGRA